MAGDDVFGMGADRQARFMARCAAMRLDPAVTVPSVGKPVDTTCACGAGGRDRLVGAPPASLAGVQMKVVVNVVVMCDPCWVGVTHPSALALD